LTRAELGMNASLRRCDVAAPRGKYASGSGAVIFLSSRVSQ